MPEQDFIVQARAIAPEVLAALAAKANARAIVPAGGGRPEAYRFPDVALEPDLLRHANAAGCDGAFVPRARRLADVRVVAMDMDSTLITIECIDEIADLRGIKPDVAAITASAMRGEIDFAQSLRLRVGLLEGLPEATLQAVFDERLRISEGARAMLSVFKAAGAKTLLASGGFTFFTERLKQMLGLDYTVANTLEIVAGKLTGRVQGDLVDATVKADTLRRLRDEIGKSAAGGIVVAIGDGANDVPMFAAADVSIAYRAKAVVRAAATHTLDHCGLDGALNLFNPDN